MLSFCFFFVIQEKKENLVFEFDLSLKKPRERYSKSPVFPKSQWQSASCAELLIRGQGRRTMSPRFISKTSIPIRQHVSVVVSQRKTIVVVESSNMHVPQMFLIGLLNSKRARYDLLSVRMAFRIHSNRFLYSGLLLCIQCRALTSASLSEQNPSTESKSSTSDPLISSESPSPSPGSTTDHPYYSDTFSPAAIFGLVFSTLLFIGFMSLSYYYIRRRPIHLLAYYNNYRVL